MGRKILKKNCLYFRGKKTEFCKKEKIKNFPYNLGVDMICGTPVLDIKPFIQLYDNPSPTEITKDTTEEYDQYTTDDTYANTESEVIPESIEHGRSTTPEVPSTETRNSGAQQSTEKRNSGTQQSAEISNSEPQQSAETRNSEAQKSTETRDSETQQSTDTRNSGAHQSTETGNSGAHQSTKTGNSGAQQSSETRNSKQSVAPGRLF